MKKVLIALAIFAGLCFTAVLAVLMYFGMQIESGKLPETFVIEGKKLKPATRQIIAEVIQMEAGEEIMFYYSTGLSSHKEDMNIITNKRLISYFEEKGEKHLDQARYEEIASIEVTEGEGWLEDSMIDIYLKGDDEGYFLLSLSAENGRDKPAIRYLQKQWGKAQEN